MESKAINENEKGKSQKLAKNFCILLKNHNLNVKQLAEVLGIPVMTIRRLTSGETTDPRISTLKLVADYFNISVDSLIEGNSHTVAKSLKKTKPHFIPILTWDTLAKVTTIDDLDLTTWQSWQPISLNEQDTVSKNAFALESRPSMYPRFPYGTIFIIDPDVNPTDGDTVLIKIKKNNELTLRELKIDPPEWQLCPIVPSSTAILYTEQNYKIVGVNILTLLYNRKVYR